MPLNLSPPLLNSSNPWATTEQDLRGLYECPSTGAVTIRTSLLLGWNHDPAVNQYAFYDAASSSPSASLHPLPEGSSIPAAHDSKWQANSSLNTLGYSPISLEEYLEIIERIVSSDPRPTSKPWIISVTGSAQEIVECYRLIREQAGSTGMPLCMEINLSCPNIANKPPPAYSSEMLSTYLVELQQARDEAGVRIPIGIKVPPYTYAAQFDALIEAFLSTTPAGKDCLLAFITATNTLGSCLVLNDPAACTHGHGQPGFHYNPVLASASGTGIGGLGGAAIHPLALGNVRTLRMALDRHHELQHIEIIGIGGVSDYAGYARMRSAGAAAVGVGTAFGIHGLGIFDSIIHDHTSVVTRLGSMVVN